LLKAVIFDLDGVLIDSYDAWFHLLNDAAQQYGFPAIDDEKYKLVFGQSVEADIDILFPTMKPEDLNKFFVDHFFDYLPKFKHIEGAAEIIAKMKERGLKTAIATNTNKDLAKAIISHLGLVPDFILGNGDVKNDKPAPDMLLKACQLLEINVEEALLVGDSDFDQRAAAAAKMKFIGFEHEGDYQVESHKELLPLIDSLRQK
jgi:HAD superfamily hydrolase (TIGR01509 family)